MPRKSRCHCEPLVLVFSTKLLENDKTARYAPDKFVLKEVNNISEKLKTAQKTKQRGLSSNAGRTGGRSGRSHGRCGYPPHVLSANQRRTRNVSAQEGKKTRTHDAPPARTPIQSFRFERGAYLGPQVHRLDRSDPAQRLWPQAQQRAPLAGRWRPRSERNPSFPPSGGRPNGCWTISSRTSC